MKTGTISAQEGKKSSESSVADSGKNCVSKAGVSEINELGRRGRPQLVNGSLEQKTRFCVCLEHVPILVHDHDGFQGVVEDRPEEAIAGERRRVSSESERWVH